MFACSLQRKKLKIEEFDRITQHFNEKIDLTG
jgi:hypothetical protein